MTRGYEQTGVAMTCRGFDEYAGMFDLKETELGAGEMLDIAAGGSSFTADASARGCRAIAVDPRYSLAPEKLVSEAEAEIALSTSKLEKLADQLDMSYYGSLANHRAGRERSLARFAAHFAASSREGEPRYVAGALPELPFADGRFALVLCSHFLFLYGEQFDYEFHERSVLDMMRVCRPGGSVCIYPLLSLRWEPYADLDRLLEAVERGGGRPERFRSGLPFIPGSEDGLRIRC